MSNELRIIERNHQAVVGSRTIAEKFGKEHKKVMRAIDNLTGQNWRVKSMFSTSHYTLRGKTYPEYLMNRDGFSLLVMGFTGASALEWKLMYIDAFNKMERLLLEKQTADWQQTRLQSKQVRLQETDAIKALIGYAREQGSQNADKLYVVYSKLVKQLAGYSERDASDVDTLMEILTFERLLFGIITSEMLVNTHYKEIYQRAKAQLMDIRRLWAMPRLIA